MPEADDVTQNDAGEASTPLLPTEDGTANEPNTPATPEGDKPTEATDADQNDDPLKGYTVEDLRESFAALTQEEAQEVAKQAGITLPDDFFTSAPSGTETGDDGDLAGVFNDTPKGRTAADRVKELLEENKRLKEQQASNEPFTPIVSRLRAEGVNSLADIEAKLEQLEQQQEDARIVQAIDEQIANGELDEEDRESYITSTLREVEFQRLQNKYQREQIKSVEPTLKEKYPHGDFDAARKVAQNPQQFEQLLAYSHGLRKDDIAKIAQLEAELQAERKKAKTAPLAAIVAQVKRVHGSTSGGKEAPASARSGARSAAPDAGRTSNLSDTDIDNMSYAEAYRRERMGSARL